MPYDGSNERPARAKKRSRRLTRQQRRSRMINGVIRTVVVVLPIPIGLVLWKLTGVQSWAIAALFLAGAFFCANQAMQK